MRFVLGIGVAAVLALTAIPTQAATPQDVAKFVRKTKSGWDENGRQYADRYRIYTELEPDSQDVRLTYHPLFSSCDFHMRDRHSDGIVDESDVVCNDNLGTPAELFKPFGGPQGLYDRVIREIVH